MHQFPIAHGELLVGGIPLTRLAARVGAGVPFYAYDRRLLDARVATLRQVLPREVRLHYALKANPMPALACHMAPLVDGMDVASGRELRVALDAGVAAAEISFAGPGKSEAELLQAVAAGILVNVESLRELPLLATASRSLGRPARVALRVNPDFELKSSGMKMGGGPKQFGIDAEQVPEALAEVRRLDLAFEGFHIFSGSQNLRAESICEAQRNAVDLALRLASGAGLPLRRLNVGGGFGIPYFPGETPLDLAPIGENLAALVQRLKTAAPGCELTVELGRYLVGEAGIYVCRILDRKISRGQVFLVADGGLHHHLAASGNFGQVIRKNYPVTIGNRLAPDAPRETASVVGPLCTPLDLLADRMDLPTARPGDLVVVFQSGAYGPSASPQAFLSHPAPVEVLV
ncbi:MAG: pyridoxal-dependent decarboxylase, exosortase A system-associated [Azonexus sp.]|jgi:diaminopimelate decarboxylase|nr:pyridoxal-dependent decarboxylase, exosortase A system-associated [Betaproteobacteria bacterium]MBK8918978.1 pyridoxal-dependent decarboxylase, exosortase A system-associated [Betaproteobacteria bacterium]MBP6035793.1 pyridoxal-dependent decarboxylase, exosortase A system-associated [Azonexus sp.]MBP6905430.1 pyridoxal-dependent decarboxylase, exosortase A system-associated [Azonexus sp.]